MMLVATFALASCSNQNDTAADTTQQTFTFKIPDTLLGSKVDLTAGTLTLTVSVDGVVNQTIIIAPGATDVTITLNSLDVGSRDITILFTYDLSPFGPLDVATATQTINVVEGVDTPLSFVTSDFVTDIFDEDGDGLSNLVELDETSTTDPTVADAPTDCILGTSLLGSCTLGP